jgi:membrane protease YdiL (CAAX protease family)
MVQMYYHWGLISRDNITLLLLLLFSALMCVVRERTKNTWNCVAFHVIYNAVVLAI